MFSPHRLITAYDSVDQCVTVTVPARTLADALAPRPEDLEVLAEATADAAVSMTGIADTESNRWDALYAAREQLAQELSGGSPEKVGRDVTLDKAHTLALVHDLLDLVADYGLVHDTAAVRAAAGIVRGVENDERRADMIFRNSLRPVSGRPVQAVVA